MPASRSNASHCDGCGDTASAEDGCQGRGFSSCCRFLQLLPFVATVVFFDFGIAWVAESADKWINALVALQLLFVAYVLYKRLSMTCLALMVLALFHSLLSANSFYNASTVSEVYKTTLFASDALILTAALGPCTACILPTIMALYFIRGNPTIDQLLVDKYITPVISQMNYCEPETYIPYISFLIVVLVVSYWATKRYCPASFCAWSSCLLCPYLLGGCCPAASKKSTRSGSKTKRTSVTTTTTTTTTTSIMSDDEEIGEEGNDADVHEHCDAGNISLDSQTSFTNASGATFRLPHGIQHGTMGRRFSVSIEGQAALDVSLNTATERVGVVIKGGKYEDLYKAVSYDNFLIITFKPLNRGVYNLFASYNGEELPGCPLIVHVD